MLAKLVFFLHVLDGVIISSWLTLAIPGSFLASPAVNTVRWGYWLSPGLVWKIPQEGMHMGRPHSHVLTQDRSRMFLLGALPRVGPACALSTAGIDSGHCDPELESLG